MGRTNAVARFAEHESLHDPILERVERDDRETAAGTQHAERCRKAALQVRELVVHRDAQRLEDARRRIDRARALGLDAEHELPEVVGREERLARASAHDRRRDAPGLRLLAVLGEDAAKLALIPGIHDVRRRDAKPGIGAHIEWTRSAEAEAAPGVRELDGRETEVEERAVEIDEAALARDDVANREVASNENGTLSEPGKDTPRLVERCGIDVKSENAAGRSGPLEDCLGVASRSDRAVEETPIFAGTKFGEYLGKENRFVCSRIARPRGP